MKQYLPFFACMLLTGCLYVNDITGYWDKGTVDETLAGKWTQQPLDNARGEKAASTFTPEVWAVSVTDGEYRMEALDDRTKSARDYHPYLARTLKVGGFRFFMTDPASPGQKAGTAHSNLWRYMVINDRLRLYTLNGPAFKNFLQAKYPEEKNIEDNAYGARLSEHYLYIKTLNENVFGALAHIPDTNEFWTIAKEYKRTQ